MLELDRYRGKNLLPEQMIYIVDVTPLGERFWLTELGELGELKKALRAECQWAFPLTLFVSRQGYVTGVGCRLSLEE